MNESEYRKLFQQQDRGVCPSPNWDSLRYTTSCVYFNRPECIHRDCRLYQQKTQNSIYTKQ